MQVYIRYLVPLFFNVLYAGVVDAVASVKAAGAFPSDPVLDFGTVCMD